MKITYKSCGVDIKKADAFAGKIKLNNLGKIGAFGSLFDLRPLLKKYKNPFLVPTSDGVGTKLKIAQDVGFHDTVGIDLVAMNVNDVVCLGARPLFFLDYIACGRLKPYILGKVVKGIGKGLREAESLLLGGETAEMPGMYKKDEYDLAGFCVGVVERDKIIDGRGIKRGDAVIGLSSSGLHSNGFSLVRKLFKRKEIRKYAKELLKPTRIYVKPILSLLQTTNYRPQTTALIKGIAHLTGGAFYHKATKIIPQGLGIIADKKSWPVPKIFKLIQERAKLDDREMYSVFNMGIGLIIVVRRECQEKVRRHLGNFYKTYLVGEVVKAKRKFILQ